MRRVWVRMVDSETKSASAMTFAERPRARYGEHLGLATGEAVVVGEEREDDLFAVNSFGPIDLGGRRSADGRRNGRGAGRVGSCFVGCLDGCWGS